MSNFEVNDFGHAIFIADKKDFKVPTDCHGHIIDIDLKYVAFKDNDDNEYIVPKDEFTFTKEQFVNKNK